MTFSAKQTAILPAVLSMVLALPVPQASAQNILDMIFGGGRVQRYAPGEYERYGEFPPPPHPDRRVRPERGWYPVQKHSHRPVGSVAQKPVEKITGPTYYTYKADPLVRVDFTALEAGAKSASLDAPVTTEFREGLAGLDGFDLYAEKDVAAALVDYYKANPEFIWVSDDAPSSRAQDAMRVLGNARSFGLDESDYAVDVPSELASADNASTKHRDMMRFEMALSARVLRYVRDAQSGRVDPNRISGYHDFPAKPLNMLGVLKIMSQTNDAQAYMESRHPQNAEFRALRAELEALNALGDDDIVVDPKLKLKPGQSSPEFPKLLRLIARDHSDLLKDEYAPLVERLGQSGVYEQDLAPVIKAVQKKFGLKADGVIGPHTVLKLAGTPKADRLQKVIYALEEMRWLPSDLGSTRVFINQPAFTATYIESDEEKLKMRVIIGRPENQTSFFFNEIKQVDYNPYWGVPQSIIVNEMLPRLRNDPGYLDRSGYEVTDAKGKRIPSSAIDWGQYGAKIPFNVRQIPSEANALGELKILFPNKHAIYMHDTPQKALFDRDSRAFSHGCIRLKDPRGMAAAVLGTDVAHIAKKLKAGHSSEKVTRDIPVYIAYFTAWPEPNGKVEYFNDVYDRDGHLKLALDKVETARKTNM
ncbi:murein L,D-transpeptidase YcbB/YkuD [Mesorhizobium soli]|uniref:L,D-transpeptidase family protein n=1 Tax=Pseudaminobacter soli (ex Li et al. 2025) TaxID=1295366 RepID=UPI0024735CAF|nr:L,D-transpeptidase family protein [Mesorhizobium soli]MDH6232767.1 murein L,D-transpeptidase YcbB/YkuD [Mesorhizobium soli]